MSEASVPTDDELIGLLTPTAEAIVTGGGYPTSPKNLRVSA